jgi:pyroglutamyl-peptidase
VRYIVARLRRLGIAAFVSRDAGTYLCNAVLYHSLLSAKDLEKDLLGAHRRVGFVHIPAALARKGGDNRGRLGGCALSWEQAFAGAIEVLATCLRRTRTGLDPSAQAGLLSRRAPPRSWARSSSLGKPPT